MDTNPEISCQLRLPPGLPLERLLEDLAVDIEAAFERSGLSWRRPADLTLREVIREIFNSRIVAFDRCGCSALCDEQVSPSVWNVSPDPALTPSDPAGRDGLGRFHLRLYGAGIEDFGDMATRILLLRSQGGADELDREIFRGIKEVLRMALGPYLFTSPLCGRLEACQHAVSIEIWERDRPRGSDLG